jgi:serine/threonine protein kinase
MAADRWEHVFALFDAALARPEADRAAFLTSECGDDASLCREVESLLAAHGDAQGFLSGHPVRARETRDDPSGPAPPLLARGMRLGVFEVEGLVGAGGMGEVYRARDTRLDRHVAIKVLSPDAATSPRRRMRFVAEARAIARLSHPRICALHEMGHHEGVDFLVMEFLVGETLAARLRRGPLPVEEAVRTAVEIGEALAAAHAQGIVHRDLKPGNVMLTKGGAKLLDFGLARLRAPAGAGPSSPDGAGTGTQTGPGLAVGTLGYMAPEQLEAKDDVDARADIFAFGAVLYEMITGRKAFEEASQARLILAILSSDPPSISVQQPLTPPAFDRVIRMCLARDRENRWASVHDVLVQLRWIAEDGSAAVPGGIRGKRRRALLPWTVAAIAVLTAAVLWGWTLRRPTTDVRSYVLSVLPPQGSSLATDEAPAISPNGRRLVFVGHDATGKQLLYARGLDGATPAEPLANTDDASLPFWSPNSQSVGFFAQGRLKKIDLATGQIQTLAEAAGARGGTWNQHDVILFVPRPGTGVYQVSAGGGQPTPVKIDIIGSWFPSFLPDGRHFLFFSPAAAKPENAGVFVGSLDSSTAKRLVTTRSRAVHATPGFLLFWREGALLAQEFDANHLEARGNPVSVADGVGLNPLTNQGLFSASDSGTVAFLPGAAGQSELVWVDRAGRRIGDAGPSGILNSLSLSPDARSVVYDQAEPRNRTLDLWHLDFARGVPSRLTFHPSHDMFPIWSPGGTRIGFSSLREGPPQLYELNANGTGTEKVVLKTSFPKTASGWSSDGRLLFYNSIHPETGGDIWALPLVGESEPFPVVRTPADEHYGTPSPDGRWLAYISNETGAYEVYVEAFPATGFRRQISTLGGFEPQWRHDGKELFYRAPNQTLMAVGITSKPTALEFSPPKALFPTRIQWMEIQAVAHHYAAAPDGQRFLMIRATEEARLSPITVVLNWTAALKAPSQ